MKLSSAFDSSLLLNGCTGKTSVVPNEVATITGDQMSYLNKSNEMKLIEKKEDMSDIVWSGIFNLSDKDGVNTIAYGSNGAIYGCYNYDNLNAASYSRAYSGNKIVRTAYAVGKIEGTNTGIMLGASGNEIFIYSESAAFNGSKTKSWTTAKFDETHTANVPASKLNASDDTFKIYNLFSTGQKFFLSTNYGLVAFDASDVNLSSFKILAWTDISVFPPKASDEEINDSAKQEILQSIQFIREKTFKFPPVTPSTEEVLIKAFIVVWTQNESTSACILQQTDPTDITAWKCTQLMKNEKCSLADIFPLNNVSFPNDIETVPPSSYSETPANEDIRWIDSSAISILPKRKIDSSWTMPITSASSIAGLGEETSSLKMKTQTGHMILARNAISSGSTKIENAPSGEIDDKSSPNIYSYNAATNKWKFEAPLTILSKNEPLPKHLVDQAIYWIAKNPQNEGGFFAKWNEDYKVVKTGINEPAALDLMPDEDFILPENSVQLFNDRSDDVILKLDISPVLRRRAYATKTLKRPIIGIERSVAESFNIQFFDIIRQCYVRWNADNEAWMISSVPMSGQVSVSINGLFDFKESSTPSTVPADVSASYSNLINPEVQSVYFGDNANLSASMRINDEDPNLIELPIMLNKRSTDFFDKTVRFRLVLELEEKTDIDFTNESVISFQDSQGGLHKIYALKLVRPADPEVENSIDEFRYAILHLDESGTPAMFEIKEDLTVTLTDEDETEFEDLIRPYIGLTVITESEVESFPPSTGICIKIPSGTSYAQYRIASNGSFSSIASTTVSTFQYVQDAQDPWKFKVDWASSSYSISKRFLYSKSGLLRERDGQIVGNEVACSLQFANGKPTYRFSLSRTNAEFIESLVPDKDKEYAGTVLECVHTFRDATGLATSHPFPAGTVALSRENDRSFLSFVKSVDGDASKVKGIPAAEDGIRFFVPKMNNGEDSFFADIPFSKTVDDETLTAFISVFIDKVYVIDRQDWTGEYSEYFNVPKTVNKEEWHYLSIDQENGIAFSHSDVEYDSIVPPAFSSIKTIQTASDDPFKSYLAFENANGNGCRVLMEPNVAPSRWDVVSYRKMSTPYILGASTIWKIDSGSESQLVIKDSTSCLNFSFHEEFHSAQVLHNEETQQDRTQIRTMTVSLHEIPQESANPEEQAPPQMEWRLNVAVAESETAIEQKDSSWIDFALDNGICVWIKEMIEDQEELHLYILDSSNELIENGITSYALHPAPENHKWNKSVFQIDASGRPARHESLYRLIQWQYSQETQVESISETLYDIKPVVRINLEESLNCKRAIADENLIYILSLNFKENPSSGLKMTGGGFCASAVNEGLYQDAIKSGLIYVTSTEDSPSCRKLVPSEQNNEYMFGAAVIEANLPFSQYSTIKQLYFTTPKKIIRWNTSFANSTFEMLQELESANSSGEWWTSVQDYLYDSTRTYEIKKNSNWPEFNPAVGSIYYVTQDHLTENTADTKYSAGRYIYVGHGENLQESYRKLPQFNSSSSSSSSLNWSQWLSYSSDTYAMAIGTSENLDSLAWMAKISYDVSGSASILNVVELLGSKRSGSFIMNELDEAVAFPYSGCEFSAISDGLSAEQEIYVGIKIGSSTKIAVPVVQKFSVPRIAGLFTADEEQPVFCLTGPIVDVVSSDEIPQSVDLLPLQEKLEIPASRTSILSMTTREDAESAEANSINPVWLWEASFYPYLSSEKYVIGAAGKTTIRLGSSGAIESSVVKKYIYAKSISKGTTSGIPVDGGALPKICAPIDDYPEDESSGSVLSEIVYYDDSGFHVKASGHNALEEEGISYEMAGTDQMSSISTIKTMKTFKAYNAPIVVGLYEKGGLILYYGSKTFDRSLLGTKRFQYGDDSGEDFEEFDRLGNYKITNYEASSENSFASCVKEQIDAAYANSSYAAGVLSRYFKADPSALNSAIRSVSIITKNKNGETSSTTKKLDDYMIETYASDLLDTEELKTAFKAALLEDLIAGPRACEIPEEVNDDSLISVEGLDSRVATALRRIEMRILAAEEKSILEKDSDDKLISSYEYSVNNSTDSQWINIPIYVKSGSGYREVEEELSTLSSSVVNGRIRLTVGSVLGNVYWRDLNPLHADRYISYIPTGLLSEIDQAKIREIEVQSGNESLQEFLDGNSSDSTTIQTLKIGWTDVKWKYKGTSTDIGDTEYTALAGSRCELENTSLEDADSQKWLMINGTLQDIKLTNAQAEAVQNDSSYNPYVFRRSSKWIVGGEQTSISVYANEPEARTAGGALKWFIGGNSTNVLVQPGIYPEIVNSNGTEQWTVNGAVLGEAILNGRPYVQNGTWLINEHGKSSPTKIFDLDPDAIVVQTIVKGEFVDSWAINGMDINYSSPASITPSVRFDVGCRSSWTFSNISMENVLVNSFKTPCMENTCPFELETDNLIIVDASEQSEEPVWTSTSLDSNFAYFNDKCMEMDFFHVIYDKGLKKWKLMAVEGDTEDFLLFDEPESSSSDEGHVAYYLTLSGKEWWLLPKSLPESEDDAASSPVPGSRIGPYASEASPESKVGSEWKLVSIADKNNVKTWSSVDVPPDAAVEIDADGKWSINGISTEYSNEEWIMPAFASSIWYWSIAGVEKTYVTRTPECPFIKRPEYCLWKDGWIQKITRGRSVQNLSADTMRMTMDESESIYHWYVDGRDTGIQCDEESVHSTKMQIINEKPQFLWRVPVSPGSSSMTTIATTGCSTCTLTKEKALSWWIEKADGTRMDTRRDVRDPLASKGLEHDGIAARMASESIWNEENRTWEKGESKWTSWTPLASLFVDAYREASYGSLESIADPWSVSNPDVMKEGMAWEMKTSEEIFGEDGVCISAEENNSWNAYNEGDGKGNEEVPSFIVYIGWKKVGDLYDSFCTIESITTGSKVRWKISQKPYRFEHVELVLKKNGTLNNIVILGSQGWIVSLKRFSVTSDGKDIHALVWNDPVNPVEELLQELEKIESYKWNSWDSNYRSEFTAVGSYGVHVYSEDCQHFEATIPYGEDSELLEVYHNDENDSFEIKGAGKKSNSIVETVLDGTGSSTSSTDSDFNTEYEKAAVNSSKSPSISISSLDPLAIYRHSHKTMENEKETMYYAFSSTTTSFVAIPSPSEEQIKNSIGITADMVYRYAGNGRTWSFVYSKCAKATKEVLGAGYGGTTSWIWSWSRTETTETEQKKVAYITISKNTNSVAYGFPDLIRFIHSYKELYSDAMEFVGSVCQFATSDRDSVNVDGVSLKTVYDELAALDGFDIYSSHLATAWKIFLKAKELRDKSHYLPNDCYNTYLSRIGQSLALEHKNYFNRAKNAMWTAQAFAKYYSDMVNKGTGK